MFNNATPASTVKASNPVMEFKCKLAHHKNKGLMKISSFNSAKELFQKISEAFSVNIGDILFCTINSEDPRNMELLLGNFLSVGDLIVVHLAGNKKVLNLNKADEFLGLTITDNGHGKAFVKRVRSSDPEVNARIKPGDHIASIDGHSAIGRRHFEVARMIREIPKQASFTLVLIEPKGVGEDILGLHSDPNPQMCRTMAPNSVDQKEELLSLVDMEDIGESAQNDDDLINSSLPMDRLISRGARDRKSIVDNRGLSYRATIERINESLESFLGISDTTLAVQLYRLAKENRDSVESFSHAINSSDLGMFSFDRQTESHIWNLVVPG